MLALVFMAKRFTDTEKWKKRLLRGIQAPYKLLWLYVCDDCNHAGVWEVDFEVARIRIGCPQISENEAVTCFGDKIIIFDDGEKWFIPSFLEFQYGELNPENRAHSSVLQIIRKYHLGRHCKGLLSPLQGCKDKDKELDKDKNKEKDMRDLTKREREILGLKDGEEPVDDPIEVKKLVGDMKKKMGKKDEQVEKDVLPETPQENL